MRKDRLFRARLSFGLLLALVTYLTVTPNPEAIEPGLPVMRWLSTLLFGDAVFSDKTAHFLAYGVLGVSAVFARLPLARGAILTPIALALYGATLEGVQGAIGARTPELMDAAANAGGAAAGFAAAFFLVKLAGGARRDAGRLDNRLP